MADLTGPNGSEDLATDFGTHVFDGDTTAPDTSSFISFSDSAGLYETITIFGGSTLGDDVSDYFTFEGDGVRTVTISLDAIASGSYAGSLYAIPLNGVSKVEGNFVGSFYGGLHAFSNTAAAELTEELSISTHGFVHSDPDTAALDKINTRVSNSGEMSAVWTLDGSPVVFTVSGFQLNGDDLQRGAFAVNFDEINYQLDITPTEPQLPGDDPLGLTFNNNITTRDRFEGSDGIDTYVFKGDREELRLGSVSEDRVSVSMSGLEFAPDTLINIERIQLTDGFLAFDTDGNAGQIYRLYQAAFDRDPDVAGLGHWIDTFDNGLFDLTGVAQEFLISEEFQTRFGTSETLNDNAYLTLLYTNVLDRTPDQGGFDYWSVQQEAGLSRADMLQHFSESAENFDNVAAEIDMGIFYL